MSVSIIGGTGPIGHSTIKQLTSSITNIISIGRRDPLISNDKIESRIEKDPKNFGTHVTKSDIFISTFGLNTPSYSAKDYHDIEYNTIKNVAQAAKQVGVKNFILYTTLGVNETSMFQVFKTKALEEKVVRDTGFERVVIVHPDVVLGERDVPKNFLTRLSVRYFEMARGTIFAFGMSAWKADEFGLANKNIVEEILQDKFPKGNTVIGPKDLRKYL